MIYCFFFILMEKDQHYNKTNYELCSFLSLSIIRQ